MKILFYNHQGKISGAERVVLLVLKRLNRRVFEPVMICPKEENGMFAEVEKLNVECRAIQPLEARFTLRPDKLVGYLVSLVKTIRQLRAAIKNTNPDLIHAVSTRSGIAATMASVGTKIPVAWHLHDELPAHPLSTVIRVFVLCFKRIVLMPVSAATGKSFRGRLLNFFENRIAETVIHNGIELEKYKFDPANRGRIRRELGLSDDEIVFGIIGQITPRKGQLELLKTFARTQKDLPSTLLIVGAPVFNRDEIYFEELKQAAKNLGIQQRVKFLGARADVAAIMQSLDALVINSRSEAMVLVALESLACRTPVIATRVGGIGEIIDHQENGWLLPFGDDRALNEALVALGTYPWLRRQLAEAGERIAVSQLGAEQFISRVEDFYKQMSAAKDLPFAATKNKSLAIQN